MALPTELSDAQLIAACRQDEEWAWNTLVDRYRRLVYSVALRGELGPEDAADVFQMVFTALLENVHKLVEPQALAAWLMTTTRRASWNVLRKRSREQSQSDEPPNTAPVDEQWLDQQRQEERWADQVMVHEALERLGGRCQQLLWLLYYDRSEPSYEQVSRQLDMPVGSIGPTRARCLEKMRSILETMGMVE